MLLTQCKYFFNNLKVNFISNNREILTDRTRKQHIVFYFVFLLLLIVLFLGTSEIILRVKNIKPWTGTHRVNRDLVSIEPGDSMYELHESLGYANLPGEYKVTLRSGYKFNITHLQNSSRITYPLENYAENQTKPEIWIFGCSYTYGWSINDNETFTWLVQEQFPEYEVINFGVNGYGTIHALLKLQKLLESGSPEIVILVHAGFHEERNTYTRQRRKTFTEWNSIGVLNQPFASLNGNDSLTIEIREVEYHEIPLIKQSSLVNFLEKKYNEMEYRRHKSDKVNQAIILEMASISKSKNIDFILAGIYEAEEMLEYARTQGIRTVDISVDAAKPEYRNLPHDNHPNALANSNYAEKLSQYLQSELSD